MTLVSSAAELPAYPFRSVNPGGMLRGSLHCVVGSTGAITVTTDHPDITCTKSGTTTGKYDITFPPCLNVKPWVTIVYASSTTILVYGAAAPSASLGTWAIQFATEAGVGAWPASTDEFDVQFIFETEPV